MWKAILKELCRFDAVCGRESALAAHVLAQVSSVCDTAEIDALGNVIAHKRSARAGAPRLLLCTPLDECGFFINEADEQGRLRICSVGESPLPALAYTRVRLESGAQGVLVPLTDKPSDSASDYAIDLGTSRRADALRLARVGDTALPIPRFASLAGRRIAGAGLESRLGVALLLALARQAEASEYDLSFLFYTQGQFGARGAGTAAFAIQPTLTIVLDYADAKAPIRLGGGAVIRHRDKSAICDVDLTRAIASVAKEEKIPYQQQLGCDAITALSPIQKAAGGRRVSAIALPIAYRKTPAQMIAEQDARDVYRLLCALVSAQSLTQGE